ncbi:hypothetical protein D3C84_1199500 [compost metagenome]
MHGHQIHLDHFAKAFRLKLLRAEGDACCRDQEIQPGKSIKEAVHGGIVGDIELAGFNTQM